MNPPLTPDEEKALDRCIEADQEWEQHGEPGRECEICSELKRADDFKHDVCKECHDYDPSDCEECNPRMVK